MKNAEEKYQVYMMPGMAANPSIFENIRLDFNLYEIHWLNWQLPLKDESIQGYAKRMLKFIIHDNPVLIGVSFGGVLVQEIAKLISYKKLIIVSSVKQSSELPKHMQFARETGVYKFLPFGLLNYISELEKLPLGNLIRKRLKLYKQYLSISDKEYLDWAVKEMVCWEQTEPISDLVHIHGDKDKVFPVSHIENYIKIEGGTHIMIVNRFRWFNENLPKLITLKKEKSIV